MGKKVHGKKIISSIRDLFSRQRNAVIRPRAATEIAEGICAKCGWQAGAAPRRIYGRVFRLTFGGLLVLILLVPMPF
jgi:hypothetical protein